MGDLKVNRLIILLVWGVLSLLVISLVSVYGYTYYSEHVKFQSYLQQLESQVLEQEKLHTKEETDKAANKVETAFVNTKDFLKDSARLEVERGIDVITHLHARYSNKLPQNELKNLIKEAIRPTRFFMGRGYYFIGDTSGNSVLRPPTPNEEGTIFSEDQYSNNHSVMLKIQHAVNSVDKAGFIEYQWALPTQPDVTHQKVGYVELFEPFGWVLGASDYVHSFWGEVEAKLLHEIDSIRFGDRGYIAVIKDDGTLLKSVGARHLEGKHYKDMPKLNHEAIKSIVEAAVDGHEFVNYQWAAPGKKLLQDKTSYIRYLPYNGWILASGVYAHDIELALQSRRSELQKQLDQGLVNLGIAFITLGLLFAVIAYAFTVWLSSRFSAYHRMILKRQHLLKLKTDRLSLSERIVESAAEGIMVTDLEGKILHVNQAFTVITGFTREEMLGERPSKLSSGKHDGFFYEELWKELKETGHWVGEIWNRNKAGVVYPQFLTINAYSDSEGHLINYIGTFQDISTQKNDQAKLNYLSDFDVLTNLPNKRVLIDRLKQNLAHIERNPDEQVAVLSVDLDNFTRINDSLGHESGDLVLVEIAERLKCSIREVDTLGRVTGDEFLIILEPSSSISTIATQMAYRLLETVSKRMEVLDADLYLTISIGIAITPDDGSSAEELLKNANVAASYAKKNGRNNFQYFKTSMLEAATKRLIIENQLNTALGKNEIELHYQPQFNVHSQQLESVEALVRWKKRDGSFIPPSEFIPVAEKTGQILEIGAWIFEEACKQSAQWLSKGIELPISINVSPVQLQSEDFVELVSTLIKKFDLLPHLIILEITETALMKNERVALDRVKALKEIGVRASLDDFGTGYSSLSLLKKVPVFELKIDKSFIDGLPDDSDDESICASLITVAHNLGLEVVAEGVETQEQLQSLCLLECDRVQGYYFSKAVVATEIEKMITSSEP